MIDACEIVLRRIGEQGPNVITIDEDFDDPTLCIVEETEVIGITENLDNVSKEKLKPLMTGKDEPFVFKESNEISNVESPFILEVPSFEWDAPKPIVLEFPK